MKDGPEDCCQKLNQTYNQYLNNLSINKHTRNQSQNIQKEKSDFLHAYRQIMDQIQIPQIKEFQANLKSHDIIIKTPSKQKNNIWNKQCIGQINPSLSWKIVNIKVILGCFSIELEICNMSIKKLTDDQINGEKNKYINKDFKGTFGVVIPWYYQQKYYATKILQFSSEETKQLSILNAIFEYSYNKLLSALQVGPKTSKVRGFDIIIYDDCIQFDMELCSTISEVKRKGQFKKNKKKQKDIYSALKLMHSLNIIHHDIKPANIMYSNQYEKFVLIDFGFTKTVDSLLGQKEITLFVGTFNYASSQMKKTVVSSDVSVDLYWNDLYGLKLSLQEIFNTCKDVTHLIYNSFCYNQDDSTAGPQYVVYFFLIIDILRTNGDETHIQDIVKLIGKQIIEQNYHFFIDFFISITPKKAIGFFCERYLKHMISNDINVRQKIERLYNKGWPRMLFIPDSFYCETYEERFSFYLKQSQKDGFISGFRNIKLIRKNKTQIQKQLLQYAKGFHDIYDNHYYFFSLLLVYFSREESYQKKEKFAKEVLQIIFPQQPQIQQIPNEKPLSISCLMVLKCKKYIQDHMLVSQIQDKKNNNIQIERKIKSSLSSQQDRSNKSKSPPLVQTVQNQVDFGQNLLSPQKQKRKSLDSRSKTIFDEREKVNNKQYFTKISNSQYKKYLYRACGYLMEESQQEKALKIINYLIGQVKSTHNLIKIYEFAVIANQRLRIYDKSAYYLKKWNSLFPFNIEQNLDILQNYETKVLIDEQEYEDSLKEVINYDKINPNMKQTQFHLRYWILRYLKLLAFQAMGQSYIKKCEKYTYHCYQLLKEYQKEAFSKQFYGNLLSLQSIIKFQQNQVQQSLRLALESNQFAPITKKQNSSFAVFICNLYCLMGDEKKASNYLDVIKISMGSKRFQEDQNVLILSGQIRLLQFNKGQAEHYFNRVLVLNTARKQRLKYLLGFAGQFKGIESHLFLFKYLQEADQLFQASDNTQDQMQTRMKIIELKLKFYLLLKDTIQGSKIFEQCQKSFIVFFGHMQKKDAEYKELATRPSFQLLKLRQSYFKNIAQLHIYKKQIQMSLKYIYQLKDVLAQNHSFYQNRSKKQHIECYSKIVEIRLLYGTDYKDPEMKQYLEYSIQCHMNHDNIIYCFNSDSYTLLTLKYLEYNKRYEKLVDVFLQICMFFTKYRNKRYQVLYMRICSQLHVRQEENARLIRYFSEVTDQIISDGSQILLFIYCIYLKERNLKYRMLSQKLIIKHISFLANWTKHIIMGKFYNQIIKDLKKTGKLTQNKQRLYLKRHLKSSNMISQTTNNIMVKKIIKWKSFQKSTAKIVFFEQKFQDKLNKIYLFNNKPI